MNRNIYIFALSIPLLLLSCTREDNLNAPVPDPSIQQEDCVPGITNIQVTEEMADLLLSCRDQNGDIVLTKAFPEGLGIEGISSIRPGFHIGGPYERQQREFGLHQWFEVTFDAGLPVTKANDEFSSIPWVKLAEPSYRMKEMSVSMNDPEYSKQWHYWNDSRFNFREGIDIGLQNAWDEYGVFGSDDVIVAIIDSGVQCDHNDLKANIWVNDGEIPGDGKDNDGNGYVDDVNGFNFIAEEGSIYPVDHGTHVAGTVAAVNNNGLGVCGVAGGRAPDVAGVKMMSIQIFDPRYPNKGYDVKKAFQYAAENGAVIAQNSWGYDVTQHVTSIPSYTKTAIDYFISKAGIGPDGKQNGPMKGGLVIFAAGNDNVTLAYPAAYPPVIAVAAVGPFGAKAPYSNYGDWVDISAPGGDQTIPGGAIYSSIPTNTYTFFQGTSMACPHVSGIAALVLSAAKAPGFTCEDLKKAVLNGVDDSIYEYNTKYQGQLGNGLAKADLALSTLNREAPQPVRDYVVVSRSNSLVFTASVPDDDNGKSKARYFNVYYSKEQFDASTADKAIRVQLDTKKLEDSADSKKRFVIRGLEFETQYWCAVTSSDFAQNESAFANIETVTTGSNTPPQVKCSLTESLSLRSWETVDVEFEASDIDEHNVVLTLDKSLPCLTFSYDAATSKGVLKINASLASEGYNSCVIKATDEYGASSRLTYSFDVQPNEAPVIVREIEAFGVGMGGEHRLTVSDYVSDPDNEPLFVTPAVSNRQVLSVSYSDGVLTFKGRSAGVTKVRLVVSDAKGVSVTLDFEVLVTESTNPVTTYPNPVTDYVHVRVQTADTYSVRIHSASGATVYSADNVGISPDSPLKIDLSDAAPGLYTLVVSTPQVSYRSQITKY